VIASHPEVRRLDRLGAIEGYEDIIPDNTMIDLVNSGVAYIEDDSMVYETYSSTNYIDMIDEEIDIISDTWRRVSKMIRDGIDPTSEDMNPI